MGDNIYGNLSNQYPNISSLTGNTLVQNNEQLRQLNANAQNLQTNLNTVASQSDALLSHQTSMNRILQNEQTRLQQKRDSVDNAYTSQQRAIYVNDNLQKRYAAYSQMVFITVITLAIVFVIALIQRFVPFIPSIIFNIIYLVLFSGGFIWCMIIFFDIQRHNPLDYDKINYKGMTATNNSTETSDADTSQSTTGMCMNAECCDPDTQEYDEEIHRCKNKAQGFSCMGNEIQNYGPYEFTDYSKY